MPGTTRTAGVIGPARPTGAAGVIGTAGPARAAGVIRPTRAAGTARSAWSTRATGMTGATRTARRPTGPTRSAGTARSTRVIGAGRMVEISGLRPAMAGTAGGRGAMPARRRRCPGSGAGEPGSHSQRGGAERPGDAHPSDKLLQPHDASPIHSVHSGSLRKGNSSNTPDTTQRLDSFPMDQLCPAHAKL